MLTALVCDCHARILPWELCAALLVSGGAYCVLERGAVELACSFALALAFLAALACSRALATRLDRPCPIGSGDMRIVPGLFAVCGLAGSMLGAFACALVNGLWALGICACMLAGRMRARGRDAPPDGTAAAPAGELCGASERTRAAPAHNAPAGLPPASECAGMPRSVGGGADTLAAQTLPMAPGLCVWFCVGVLCV